MAKTKEQILQEAMAGAVSPQTQVPVVGGQDKKKEIVARAMAAAPVSRAQQFQQAIEADPIARTLYSIPGTRPIMEFANAAGRSVADVVDFFGPDFINSILQVSGSEARMPTLRGSLESVGALAPAGAYMQPGLAQEIVTGAGEAIPAAMGGQGLLRYAERVTAPMIPEIAGAGRRVLQTMASTTPAQEAVATTGAVIGGELGEEMGVPGAGLVGSLVGGAGAIPLIRGVDQALSNVRDFRRMSANLSGLKTDVAAEILAKSLISSGMSVDDAMKRYEALGPNAIPADIDDSFRNILRAAMNVDVGTSGAARTAVQQRQLGSGRRIAKSLDIISADNLDDYIARVDSVLGPQVSQAYEQAAQNPLALSGRLRNLLNADNSLGRAAQKAQAALTDRRAAGDTVSHFDLIDETKRVLDDSIGEALRGGRSNEARRLIRLKNVMISEADAQIPEYARARALYAGRAALDDAATLGREIFTTENRELRSLVANMTPPERNAYILSAKDEIIRRIENTGETRNQVQALFGKNGSAQKLATLFTDPKERNRFMNALRRETEFAVTRNAVMGNSTTAQQLQTIKNAMNPPGGYGRVFSQARQILSDPTSAPREISNIIDGLNANKNSELYTNALIRAGDILLASGMNAQTLGEMLRRGSAQRLAAELRRIAPPDMSGRAATTAGIAAQQMTGSEE